MKKFVPVILIAFLSLLFMNCTKNSNGGNNEKEPSSQQKPITIEAAITNSITKFSFNFFKNLQTDPEYADKNTFVSPLSLHMALGMLVNGATGTTKTEIMKALNAEGISQEDLNATYKKLLTELPAADPKVKLGLANSIWYKNTFIVENAFLTGMKDNFNAQITALPFVQSDVDIINKWASDNTNAKIPKVLSEIKKEAVMFLINALYFKGDWTKQFDTKNTKDQSFILQDGSSKTVKMMNATDSLEYAAFIDYHSLQMPYGNGQFRATLILPKTGTTINSLFDNFNMDKWNDLQSKLVKKKVIAGIPKFTLNQEFDLNKTLIKMGMSKAFTDFAELYGISKAPTKVDFIKQNTFAAVDEVGTEAAAVTTIGIIPTSINPDAPAFFICDRPFAFIISEKTSNTILFMGKVMSPE